MERDEFVNENFIRGFPELRKNIIKKKVSALVMQSLLLIMHLNDNTSLNSLLGANCIWLMLKFTLQNCFLKNPGFQ